MLGGYNCTNSKRFSGNRSETPKPDNLDMRKDREGFVIWIDTAESGIHGLRGAAEWTRTAQRFEFDSALELERFLERCIATRDALEVEGTERSDGEVPAPSTANDTGEQEIAGESEQKP